MQFSNCLIFPCQLQFKSFSKRASFNLGISFSNLSDLARKKYSINKAISPFLSLRGGNFIGITHSL